jgi:hypothetical protein
LDIFLYGSLIVNSDAFGKVAIGPETIPPQELFQLRVLRPDHFGAATLEELYHFGYGKTGWKLDQHMDVVGHYFQLLQIPLVYLYAIVKEPFDPGGYFALEHSVAIFRCPDQMILQSMSRMRTMPVFFFHGGYSMSQGVGSHNLRADCSWPPSESFTTGLKAGVP